VAEAEAAQAPDARSTSEASPVAMSPSLARQLWDASRSSFPLLSRIISLATISSVVALLAQWHEFRSNVDKDLADRFSAAIVNIDDPEPAIRIAALYDLEHIAASSSQYEEPLKEILPVYIQDHSPVIHAHPPARPTASGASSVAATSTADSQDHAALNLDAMVHEDNIGNDARAALDVLLRLTASTAGAPGPTISLPIDGSGPLERAVAWLASRFSSPASNPAQVQTAQGECVDLSGINLHGATFVGTALDGYCFVGSDLVGAVFSHATLSRVDFTDAALVDAILSGTGTTIANTIFAGSSLEWADLSGASLTGVLFSPAADRVNLDGSKWLGSTMRSVYFAGATLVGADFGKARLVQVTFSDGADLRSARFADAELANVAFADANLSNVDFTGATIRCVRFAGSRVEADFRSATFDAVDLRSADLTRSRISADQLKHAYYDQTTIWPDPQFHPPPPTISLGQLTAGCYGRS
jgi:uncharacterized protein YjbI with pentapeptide repeats